MLGSYNLLSNLMHINIHTLTCQIIVQDHLIVQVADFSEINKRVGLNKAVQEGFFLIYVGENQVLKEKSQKLINVQVLIRLCRCFFPPKLIRFAARLFGRSEQVLISNLIIENNLRRGISVRFNFFCSYSVPLLIQFVSAYWP